MIETAKNEITPAKISQCKIEVSHDHVMTCPWCKENMIDDLPDNDENICPFCGKKFGLHIDKNHRHFLVTIMTDADLRYWKRLGYSSEQMPEWERDRYQAISGWPETRRD